MLRGRPARLEKNLHRRLRAFCNPKVVTILSHRGYWHLPREKNSPAAFARSFAAGFGTETDLRDCNGALVIAHDPAGADAMPARDCLALHAAQAAGTPLALNIKADGLVPLLASLLAEFSPKDYFCFDMSVPETRRYLTAGLPVFVRQSDCEPEPLFLDRAAGVWADAFGDDRWITREALSRHLDAGRRVCVVSPELHGRDPQPLWERLQGTALTGSRELLLCTDRPAEAKNFFSTP